MPETTPQLYDRRSSSWKRGEPVLLSDYTARPFLLDWCRPVDGLRVLDLGCGEGYVARQLARDGASVQGIDVSTGMIDQAKAQEAAEPLGIDFRAGDARQIADLPDDSFDLVVAVFLFNYLTIDGCRDVLRHVRRVLRPRGRFIFSVPHPSLPFLRERGEAPFWFDPERHGYFSGKDQTFEGRIHRRDGEAVPVRCVHKTFEDYFMLLRGAGFTSLPEVAELRASREHVALDPEFFESLWDQPLHVAFRCEAEASS